MPPQQSQRRPVERIGRDHALDGAIIGTRFESLLSNCLEILSSQLYANSAHFLLELIQNAENNTYTGVCPTLRFTYRPESLRIDYNEIGFTAENVKATIPSAKAPSQGR
ncbi:hypothetical protein LCI18_013990 [Fusarium solani-melongenae]|uniref:Uncharacterized protein n=1 Tax=Fusarium solani subsp. cucurbitae TaxID=2747967 RepID=A0ACD3ZPA3_FUSSC|nr:hypothetical protein LCI18_013990 [Fusarium solani-melongenae]